MKSSTAWRAAVIGAALTCNVLAAAPLRARAQRGGATEVKPALAVPDISGSWERYGGFGRGARANDPTIPPPNPPPPLKGDYLKEWQARVQAARDADAKGTPLASNATYC